MEHKIGEIFKHNGEWYQCIRSILTCSSCEIPRPCTKIRELGCCSPNMRNDKEQVVFKKLEKVGEPYRYQGIGIIMVQEYILANTNYIWEYGQDIAVMDCQNGKVAIEIEQNKEDMEENKTPLPKEDNHLTRTVYNYVNGKISDKELIKSIKEMSDEYPYDKHDIKPFSLEEAKSGKPVCTRDGRKARIICFDRKHLYYQGHDYPIVALIDEGSYAESVGSYTKDGLSVPGKCYDKDLMMLAEKKEGRVNTYI